MDTSTQRIPPEMPTNGRLLDNVFEPEEDLYVRFQAMDNEKEVSVTNFRYPQSVNRSKYSEPEWVLIPSWTDWGYGSFTVKDITRGFTHEKICYHLKVEHEPEEMNYSHSGIRAYKDNENTPARRINNREAQYQFRHAIAKMVNIMKLPLNLDQG